MPNQAQNEWTQRVLGIAPSVPVDIACFGLKATAIESAFACDSRTPFAAIRSRIARGLSR